MWVKFLFGISPTNLCLHMESFVDRKRDGGVHQSINEQYGMICPDAMGRWAGRTLGRLLRTSLLSDRALRLNMIAEPAGQDHWLGKEI